MSSGSKPSPWSRTRIVSSGTSAVRRGLELDEDALGGVVRLPCLMALMTDSRIATLDPVQRILVEADVARDVVADDLHEIEHLERAGELEANDLVAVDRHVLATGINTIPSHRVMSSRRLIRKIASDATPCRSAVTIAPARRVRGRLRVPGDKSISHRYALLAALADGRSTLPTFRARRRLPSTLACLRGLGVDIGRMRRRHRYCTGTRIRADSVRRPAPLDAGNSGTTMRMLAGLLAAQPVHEPR